MTEEFTFETNKSSLELTELFRSLTDRKPKGFLSLLTNKLFTGHVNGNSFNLQTYDSPPIEVHVELSVGDKISTVKVIAKVQEGLGKGVKFFIYALLFPLAMFFFVYDIYQNEISFLKVLGFSFLFIAIWVFGKVQELLQPKPNLNKLITRLKSKIEK